MRFHTLRSKIILICTVCITVVGILSNTLLYLYLTSIITEKADSINQLALQSIQFRLNQALFHFEILGDVCSHDTDMAHAMRNRDLTTLPAKREAMRAHDALRRYLSASNMKRSISKLMAFNEHGVMVQAASNVHSALDDTDRVRALPLFDEARQSSSQRIITISPSIVNGQSCIAFLSPIDDNAASGCNGWFYAEMSLGGLHELITLYGNESFYIADSEGEILGAKIPPFSVFADPSPDGAMIRQGRSFFRLHSVPLRLAGLTLYSITDLSALADDGRPVLFITLSVSSASLAAAVILAALLSGFITKPLGRLTSRIRKISDKDFSYDPDIERGNDEISLAGKTLNEMSESFSRLLHTTEEMLIQQKNAEIALLQSQVNPHFLYNTLDSIHWMAAIQKNTGIMTMTRSLSSLLRNLAKDRNDKITLGEELTLVRDYINIQSLRYMGNFTYINRVPESLLPCLIVKFTLQPLVENAIFHGIEPKATAGMITIDAESDEGFLFITVRDDGVGMTPEELGALAAGPSPRGNQRLSGVGVFNVHERFRLIYGEDCGLSYQSEKGLYTEVKVRIPEEEKTDDQGSSGG